MHRIVGNLLFFAGGFGFNVRRRYHILWLKRLSLLADFPENCGGSTSALCTIPSFHIFWLTVLSFDEIYVHIFYIICVFPFVKFEVSNLITVVKTSIFVSYSSGLVMNILL